MWWTYTTVLSSMSPGPKFLTLCHHLWGRGADVDLQVKNNVFRDMLLNRAQGQIGINWAKEGNRSIP